jgi:hypothetical protein
LPWASRPLRSLAAPPRSRDSAAAGEQPHGVAGAADDQPISVVLDLVHPARPGWRLGGTRGNFTAGRSGHGRAGRIRFVDLGRDVLRRPDGGVQR